jgi:anti-anti-sigma regulatory factor
MNENKIILDFTNIAINLEVANDLEKTLDKLSDDCEIIIDLQEADYINSLGISTLLIASRHKKKLIVKIKDGSNIHETFNVLGLIDLKDCIKVEVI